jgi:hypothetical protein
MRSDTVPEIDSVNHPSLTEVYHNESSSVGAWQTDSGIPVDRDESPFAIGGGGDFMPGYVAFGDVGNLATRIRIDQA